MNGEATIWRRGLRRRHNTARGNRVEITHVCEMAEKKGNDLAHDRSCRLEMIEKQNSATVLQLLESW